MPQDLFSSLKAFIAVVDYQGFASAARHIHVSAPVITKQIKSLENYLGKSLLQRTTRQFQLTEAGRIYLEYARHLLAEIESAKHAVLDIEAEPHGMITLGIPAKLNALMIAKNLREFLEKYPKIKCRIVLENTPAAVIDGVADIVICPFNTADPQLIKQLLFTAETGIFASPGYIQKHGKPKNIDELKMHNCLINTKLTPDGIWKFQNRQKIKVRGNYESDIGGDILIGAINDMGLVYLFKRLADKEIKAKEIVEISLGVKPDCMNIYIYSRPSSPNSITRLLVDHLMKSILA